MRCSRVMMMRTPKVALANHHIYLIGATVAAPTAAARVKRIPSPTKPTVTALSDLAMMHRFPRTICGNAP
jgi:hypothetical protein